LGELLLGVVLGEPRGELGDGWVLLLVDAVSRDDRHDGRGGLGGGGRVVQRRPAITAVATSGSQTSAPGRWGSVCCSAVWSDALSL